MSDDFADYDRRQSQQKGNAAPPLWIDDDAWIEADIPRRPWLAPRFALRGAVTVVVGPPSAMKSSLMLAWAVATALNLPHGGFCSIGQDNNVLVYNVEDDQTEQRRRLSAVLRQFNETPSSLCKRITRVGPTTIGTLFTIDKQTGEITSTDAMTRLRELIRERETDLLIVDPLAELHTSEENDNTALRTVVAALRALAIEFNIAVVVIHHTRKGTVAPGDPDSARGASSIIGAGRVVLTLTTMSEEDAKAFGIPTGRQARSQYVRLDDAKQNYAGVGDGEWYEKVPYILDNGEVVPAAVPWQPPDFWKQLSTFASNAILDLIEAGLPDERRYSPAPQAKDRAAWPLVQTVVPTINDEQAKMVIATWLKNGVVETRTYHDPDARKDRSGLYVNPAKRPG
jgi:AAA domain